MLRSLMAKLLFTICKFPAALASASVNGTAINVSDFGSLCFLISVGTFAFDTTNKVTIQMQHSDTNVDGDFVNCATADVYGGEGAGVVKTIDSALEDEALYPAHYLGNKKFARIRLVVGGTVTAVVGIHAVQGHPEAMPPA